MSEERQSGATGGATVEPPPENEWAELDESDGKEIASSVALDVIHMSEINQAMEYARLHPRSLATWKKKCLEMITLSEAVAGQCFYSLPRKEKNKDTGAYEQKNIVGPSARFAEIIASRWCNCRAGAKVLGEDETGEFVRAQGVF